MSKPDAPPAPDYAALAKQQGTDNRETAQFNANTNRVDQYGPDGSIVWSRPGQQNGVMGPSVLPDGAAAVTTAPGPQVNMTTSAPIWREQGRGGGGYWEEQAPVAAGGAVVQGSNNSPQSVGAVDDGSGWVQTTSLSPANQRLYDMNKQGQEAFGNVALSAIDRVKNSLGQEFDTSGMQALDYGPDATTSQGMSMEALANFLGNPQQQAVASQGTAGQGSAAQAALARQGINSTIDRSGVRALPGTIDDTSRRRVEEALMSRINPSLQRDEDQLRNRLLNSGIEVGTDAYNRELLVSGQRMNDARMSAVLAGGTEESRQVQLQQGLQAQEFAQAQAQAAMRQAAESQLSAQETQTNLQNAGMLTSTSNNNAGLWTQASMGNANLASSASALNANLEARRRENVVNAYSDATRVNAAVNQQNFNQGLASSTANNATRAQDLSEAAALRMMPLNEANALRNGAQVSMPNFASYYTGASAAPAPVMEGGIAQGQYDMNAYNQEVAGNNALWGGLATLGGAAIKSDRRLKTNLRKIGDHPVGVARYTWDWLDGSGSSSGVMAQDLQAVRPDAVVTMPSGYLGVRYDLIGGQ